MTNQGKNTLDLSDEIPAEENFIEQAEYIDRERFVSLAAEHPYEAEIMKKLMGGGAKLLIGPRGCGKSTLMRKAYFNLLDDQSSRTLPVYVNFKLALKMEPYYIKGPNASYWFRAWLVLKIFRSLREAISEYGGLEAPEGFPDEKKVDAAISALEASSADGGQIEQFSTHFLCNMIDDLISENGLRRCVVLIDDAAHSFSEKQQEDFFDLFRAIKSRNVSPKAAIYPGITSHSANFHVGHDAEQIDAWVMPSGEQYEDFMISLAQKRFEGTGIDIVSKNEDDIKFLAYASFGIPRGFLSMLRSIFNSPETYINSAGKINKTKTLKLSRIGRDMSHSVYESLNAKLPSYESYVENGTLIYQAILSQIRAFNQGKPLEKQGTQFAIKTPIGADLEKVFGFLQYSGLIMRSGSILKGEKGSFLHFQVHVGDLTTENILVGSRAKSIKSFLTVIRAQKHQAWPRLTTSSLLEAAEVTTEEFTLALPLCHACGTPRSNPDAKFCSNCGTQLKPSSTYEALVKKDISTLPISSRMEKRIKDNSNIRRVRDILMDSSRETLLGIPYIGKFRAQTILGYAEEYVS
jgi:energy-coupling factor transporter ATP-binding protein EcfA2